MKSIGIDKGLVQKFETSDKRKGNFFGFDKMFWDFLKKLEVPFYAKCCEELNTSVPVRQGKGLEYFAGTLGWLPVPSTTVKSTAAYNATANVTVADLLKGVLTSTSAAVVTLTLPTAASFLATQGTSIDFTIDNGAGASVVTLAVNTGITASSVVTGGTTLTVAAGVVGQFKLYFQSSTVAKLARIA